jgi:ABC-2 type transport system ATP-binding protein
VIELANVSAHGPAERGRARSILTNVSLEQPSGLLAIIGTLLDGTSLVLDVVDGTVKPKAGRVVVLGGSPDAARARVARVALDAPLPEALRVDEVCDLSSDLRGEARQPAAERLAVLGIGSLARRNVRSLVLEERRAVALALALTSRAEVLLVDEPLVAIDPVAPRLVVDALRARAAASSVIVTTASARDATRLGDRLGVMTSGVYTALPPELAHTSLGPERSVSMRVVVCPSHGKAGAASLVGALSAADAVTRVDTSTYAAPSGAVGVVVSGRDLTLLARAITHAIATTSVEIELVEPSTLSLDAIRAALAARAMSPPVGSLPPGSMSMPPSAMPGSIPPAGVPASLEAGPVSPAAPAVTPRASLPPVTVPPRPRAVSTPPPPVVAPVETTPASVPPASVPPGSVPSKSEDSK